MKPREAWELTKETFSDWVDDKASRLAAALAYYTLFSLAPLLIIAIGIAGLVFGEEAAQGQIMGELQGMIGESGAAFLQDMLAASREPAHSLAATVIGVAVLLFGATNAFGQLQDAMNTIWQVQSRPGRAVRAILAERFLSFAMVLGTGFLLLVSLALSAAFAAIGAYLSSVLPIPEFALQSVNFALSFGLTSFLFALIFKVVPDAKIAWRDVWIGAILTALLFSTGKLLIGIYLGKSSVASTFGAAASPVILMVWIYYSAQILFLGAEFTQVYATRFGSRIQPARGAIPLTRPDP
jgi:membrane protein